MRRRAYIEIPAELLRELLHLREEFTIVGAEWRPLTEGVLLFLSGDRLPAVREGDAIERRPLAELTRFPNI